MNWVTRLAVYAVETQVIVHILFMAVVGLCVLLAFFKFDWWLVKHRNLKLEALVRQHRKAFAEEREANTLLVAETERLRRALMKYGRRKSDKPAN